MSTQFDHRTATENEVLRYEARQRAERIADDLAARGDQIRGGAAQFANPGRPAAAIVADIVSAYIQGGNTIGASFWGMIRELSRMK